MFEVVGVEEFKALANRVAQVESENEFLRSLLLGERWLSRAQAMAALGCQHNKLRQLHLSNTLTYRYEGKNPFYDAFSIRIYLAAQKIDALDATKRILTARYGAK